MIIATYEDHNILCNHIYTKIVCKDMSESIEGQRMSVLCEHFLLTTIESCKTMIESYVHQI